MQWAYCAPTFRDVVSEIAEPSPPFHHPHRKHICIFWCVGAPWLRPSSQPLLGLRVGGSDNPRLVCGGWGSSYSPFPVFLWMLSSGWVGSKHFQKFSTTRLFPQLFCLSCVERSQQNCGWRRESWEKYSTGISCVGCAERSCVLNDKSVRLNTPQKWLVVNFLLLGAGGDCGRETLQGHPPWEHPQGGLGSGCWTWKLMFLLLLAFGATHGGAGIELSGGAGYSQLGTPATLNSKDRCGWIS